VRFYRKVIRIKAEDSPNVMLGLRQRELGIQPTGELVLDGVLPYDEYVKRRATWSPQRQTIGLDAMFHEGDEELLFPPMWIAHSERLAEKLKGKRRNAKGVGIDPGEGRAETVYTASDELGIIEQIAKKTPNTAVIVGETIAFGKKHGVPPEQWLFDRGGGGKQHADRLRDKGYDVRCVGFGERPSLPMLVAGSHFAEMRAETKEVQYTYRNLRTQMYFELHYRCDPQHGGWAIPASCTELIRQLSAMPKLTDDEGRPLMLSKGTGARDERRTLWKLIGCSPDEADSCVLSDHAVHHVETGALVEAG
jgi:hypothetical protein